MKIPFPLLALLICNTSLFAIKASSPRNTPNEISKSNSSLLTGGQPMGRTFQNSKMIMKAFRQFQKNWQTFPNSSGIFEQLSDFRLDTSYSLSSFDDAVLQGSGHVANSNITLAADFGDDYSIGLGFNKSRFESGGSTHLLANSIGASLFLHKNINDNYGVEVIRYKMDPMYRKYIKVRKRYKAHDQNDNYGVGGFAFYDSIDIKRVNGNTYALGAGLSFTTWHDLGSNIDLSTVSVISKTHDDDKHGTGFMSSARLAKNWDKYSFALSSTFSDSLRHSESGDLDTTFWQFGGELTYFVNQSFTLTLGYEKTESLKSYNDNTIMFDLNWSF
ncbi:MAG: 30S ribosomal protein S17 [Lentisphaeraceae bacterium]|nr:30S ribosomal protein S17 [Lentisphaeraceae bacterium]